MAQREMFDWKMPDSEWCSWFSGLVDGEGSFILQRVGGKWAFARFAIHMRADDKPMIAEIRDKLGFGRVEHHKKGKIGHAFVGFVVQHVKYQLKLITLFDQFPLRSRKRRDYEIWRTFVLLHQNRKNATDPRIDQLLQEIRDVRIYKESPDAS